MKRLLLVALLVATPAMAAPLPSLNWPAPADRGAPLLRTVVLNAHNDARAEFGVAPMAWSEQLATEAMGHAQYMARTGIYGHDQTPGRRKKQGENLWMGTRGAYRYEVMLGHLVDEWRHYRPGRFPNISRTGTWSDVSHYTQIVWPTTTHVGCATASNRSDDYLVCRYLPAGNVVGTVLR